VLGGANGELQPLVCWGSYRRGRRTAMGAAGGGRGVALRHL